MTTPLAFSGWGASEPTCERYAVHELLPGMSHDTVLSQMGGEGVKALIRMPGSPETSGVDYSNPTSDVYLEYDRRVDRRRTARAVRVRASMPLSPTTLQTLVSRLGPPDAGANDLADGLLTGVAVWVDEACGVVSTAYRSASWWTAGGGIFLQVETLDLVRQGGSPASPRLEEILARKHGPAAVAVPATPETLPVPPPLLLVRITADAPPSPPPVPKP